jgi:hypothetical protein
MAASARVPDERMIATMLPARALAPPTAHADQTRTVSFASTVGAALVLAGLFAVAVLLAPRPIPSSVRRAGENFVSAFARPLVDASSGVSPIQTRLRFVRRKQQLEIAIAPEPGHRYPNLADHKKNLEYDVDRVMRVLGGYVLTGPPRAAGKWVIVAIRPAIGQASRMNEASRTERDT